MAEPLTIGAVAYSPRVAQIWTAFERWFDARGTPIRARLFESYPDQLEALFDREIDVAWNTNLAYAQAQQRANGRCQMLAMRDTDQDWYTHALVRAGAPMQRLEDLASRRIGFASSDSPQGAILPMHFMRKQGFDPQCDAHAELLEIDLGKHGDTGGAEVVQLRRLANGEIDAAIVSDATCAAELTFGVLEGVELRRIWTTPPYNHCNFTVLPGGAAAALEAFREGLYAMTSDDPSVAEAMRLEGVNRWIGADERGYTALYAALAGSP